MKKNLFNALFICVCVALVVVSVDSVSCHRANMKLRKVIRMLRVEANELRASDNDGSTYDLESQVYTRTLPEYAGIQSK